MGDADLFREDQISRSLMRFRAVQRNILWNYFSGRLPLYLVTEFPKSGATWYAKMLSELLQVPFPKPRSQPRLKTMILRDKKLYKKNYKNVSVVMRDGRDVMISAYYHYLFPNELNLHFAVEERRKRLPFKDYYDIETNLPEFIEYMFEVFPKQGFSARFSWADFVDSWFDKGKLIVQYEDLISEPVPTMQQALLELTGEMYTEHVVEKVTRKYSFKNITGRDPGTFKANSFARKGIAGDWKNHFNSKAKYLFASYAGKQLIKLGYEENDGWVNKKE